MVGKRWRRGPLRALATLSGLAPIVGGAAEPMGLGRSSRGWSSPSSSPIPTCQKNGTKRFDVRFVSSQHLIVGDPQRSGWFQ